MSKAQMKKEVSKFYVTLIVLSLIGIAAFQPFFQERVLDSINPPSAIRRLKIIRNIDFDLIGALIPTLISLGALSYLLLKKKLMLKSYFIGLLGSIVFVLIFSGSGTGAITINFVYVDCFVALITFIILSYKDNVGKLLRNPIKELSNHEWHVSKHDLPSLFLVGYAYSSLSVLIMDLMYLPLSGFSMYIGGMGTVDGIFLSGLFIFMPLTLLVAFINSGLLVTFT